MSTSKKPSFEQKYNQLEKIVEDFESGKIDLSSALDKFKLASTLAKELKKELSGIENKITEIKKDFEE